MDKEKIYRAGVIPYIIESDELKMMFMRPSDTTFGGKKFQVAKGKIEKGESKNVAAFREAKEEMGLFKGNVINEHDLGNFLGRTQVFLAEIKDLEMFGDPHFETAATKWLTLEQFKDTGRELHYPIVQAAARWIKKKNNI